MRPVGQQRLEMPVINQSAFPPLGAHDNSLGLSKPPEHAAATSFDLGPTPQVGNLSEDFDFSVNASQQSLSWDEAMKNLDKPLGQMPGYPAPKTLPYQSPYSMLQVPANEFEQASNHYNQPMLHTFSNGMTFDWSTLFGYADWQPGSQATYPSLANGLALGHNPQQDLTSVGDEQISGSNQESCQHTSQQTCAA